MLPFWQLREMFWNEVVVPGARIYALAWLVAVIVILLDFVAYEMFLSQAKEFKLPHRILKWLIAPGFSVFIIYFFNERWWLRMFAVVSAPILYLRFAYECWVLQVVHRGKRNDV